LKRYRPPVLDGLSGLPFAVDAWDDQILVTSQQAAAEVTAIP